MVAYQIAELSPDAAGGFAPRGAVRDLWTSRDPETIIAGPAETGKTYGCLHWLDACMWKYPGAQAAIVRKTYNSAIASVVQTYERKVLGANSPVRPYGGDRPQWYDYPNHSRVWVGGMDNPGKVLSSERDIIYANQAEELTLDDWETLRTRATGRAGNMPYARSVGDCNPGPPQHWILQRERDGRLRVLHSRHEDNPSLYDDHAALTDQGRATMAVLDSLTGVRYQRLRLGLWVSAEGTVYELKDAHLGDDLFQPDKPTQLAVDPSNGSGPYAALVLQQVGQRVLVVGEFYLVGGMDEDLRDWLLASPYLARLTKVVCDPAKQDTIKRLRAMLKVHVQAKEGRKDITAQISAVKSLMVVDPQTKQAPLVIDRGNCPMLLDEFSQYRWKQPAGGRAIRTERARDAQTGEMVSVPIYDDEPEDAHNHCLDALAYWVTTRALLGSKEVEKREQPKPAVPWYAQPSGVRR
jgi:hypothetical protein